jgi:hypothetical protein
MWCDRYNFLHLALNESMTRFANKIVFLNLEMQEFLDNLKQAMENFNTLCDSRLAKLAIMNS